jgi:hypothetical protein
MMAAPVQVNKKSSNLHKAEIAEAARKTALLIIEYHRKNR